MTDNIFGPPPVDQLGALRDQRALLGPLRDDVQAAWCRLVAAHVEGSWRSHAQRAYADRVHDLCRELQMVVRELEAAEATVNSSIDRVTVGM
ncbi:hypothetical protein [Cryobacterium sp. MLB-32]|uniref:hypothetical protein n=1 Tax=Cryobacterium sp. MLB-32 TaxID=1529318 RepID=UPI0012E0B3A1|nr:hypothetical protein [Cryobacterium sp. MLB-32]